MLMERVLAQDNGPEEGEEPEMPVKAVAEPEADDPDEAEEDHDDEPDDQGSRRGNRAVMDTRSRGKSHGSGKNFAGIGIARVVIGFAAIGL